MGALKKIVIGGISTLALWGVLEFGFISRSGDYNAIGSRHAVTATNHRIDEYRLLNRAYDYKQQALKHSQQRNFKDYEKNMKNHYKFRFFAEISRREMINQLKQSNKYYKKADRYEDFAHKYGLVSNAGRLINNTASLIDKLF